MRKDKIDAIFNRFAKQLENEEISVCDLGSCQYETISQSYSFFLELFEAMGVENALKAFEIKTWKKQELDEILKYLTELVNENLLEDEKPIDAFESISEYFEYAREHSWDLWSAVISYEFLLNTKDELKTIKTPTFGPIFNQLAQEDSFEQGFELAILTQLFGVDIDSFAGFDT